MSEAFIALIPAYGLWLVGITTFLSCLAMPVPASLLMLTAGGFAAGGDLVLWETGATALGGAVMGDQMGFAIARRGGAPLINRLFATPKRRALIAQAQDMLSRMGGTSVFLSRWLMSPLGPYMNIASGALAMDWRLFTVAGILGEVIWVSVYVGLGYGFADNITALSDALGNASGMIAGLAVTLGLGVWILRRGNARKAQP